MRHRNDPDPATSTIKSHDRHGISLEKKDGFVTKETGGIGNTIEIALDTIWKTTSLVAEDSLGPDTRHRTIRGRAQVSRLRVLGARLVERKRNRGKGLRKENKEASL